MTRYVSDNPVNGSRRCSQLGGDSAGAEYVDFARFDSHRIIEFGVVYILDADFSVGL